MDVCSSYNVEKAKIMLISCPFLVQSRILKYVKHVLITSFEKQPHIYCPHIEQLPTVPSRFHPLRKTVLTGMQWGAGPLRMQSITQLHTMHFLHVCLYSVGVKNQAREAHMAVNNHFRLMDTVQPDVGMPVYPSMLLS